MRPARLTAAALLALGAAALAVALAPAYRSPDSWHYLDVARSLSAGLGPVSFLLHLASPAVPAPTGLWPGGYPAALALLARLGLDLPQAPSTLNALSLVALAVAAWSLGRLAALPPWLAALAAAAATAHPALRHVLAHAWSEPPFVALATCAVALLAAALLRERPVLALAAGGCAGLAFTVRYGGLFLAGYLLAAAAVTGLARRWPLRRHLLHAGLLAVGPLLSAPLALSANLQAYGRPLGLPRLPVPDLGAALLDRGRELLGALELLTAGWGLLALLALALAAAWAPAPEAAPPPGRRLVAALLVGWVPWYLAALVASVAGIVTDPIDARLAAPAVPALLVAAFALAGPRLAGLRVGPLVSTVGLALALLVHADDAWRRRLDPPLLETPAELVAAVRRQAGPGTLVVASRGWELRDAAGVAVLEDGYPDMAPLEPRAILRFLGGPGRAFTRAALVLGPAGSLPAARLGELVDEARRAGWRDAPPEAAGEAVLLELRREAAPDAAPDAREIAAQPPPNVTAATSTRRTAGAP